MYNKANEKYHSLKRKEETVLYLIENQLITKIVYTLWGYYLYSGGV